MHFKSKFRDDKLVFEGCFFIILAFLSRILFEAIDNIDLISNFTLSNIFSFFTMFLANIIATTIISLPSLMLVAYIFFIYKTAHAQKLLPVYFFAFVVMYFLEFAGAFLFNILHGFSVYYVGMNILFLLQLVLFVIFTVFSIKRIKKINLVRISIILIGVLLCLFNVINMIPALLSIFQVIKNMLINGSSIFEYIRLFINPENWGLEVYFNVSILETYITSIISIFAEYIGLFLIIPYAIKNVDAVKPIPKDIVTSNALQAETNQSDVASSHKQPSDKMKTFMTINYILKAVGMVFIVISLLLGLTGLMLTQTKNYKSQKRTLSSKEESIELREGFIEDWEEKIEDYKAEKTECSIMADLSTGLIRAGYLNLVSSYERLIDSAEDQIEDNEEEIAEFQKEIKKCKITIFIYIAISIILVILSAFLFLLGLILLIIKIKPRKTVELLN